MRWPWVHVAKLRLVERDLQVAHRRANEAESRMLDLSQQVDRERDRATQWRRLFLHERATVRRHEGEITALRARAESAESAYRGLVEKVMAPPPQPVAPAPHVPLDPDAAGLTQISDETVKNMAAQFVRDGMSPDVAEQHARDLVQQADRMWGAVDVA